MHPGVCRAELSASMFERVEDLNGFLNLHRMEPKQRGVGDLEPLLQLRQRGGDEVEHWLYAGSRATYATSVWVRFEMHVAETDVLRAVDAGTAGMPASTRTVPT